MTLPQPVCFGMTAMHEGFPGETECRTSRGRRGACCPHERALRACILREGYGWTPRKTCFKIPIRLARATMEAAIQYAKERETFGTKIGNSQRLVIARYLLG